MKKATSVTVDIEDKSVIVGSDRARQPRGGDAARNRENTMLRKRHSDDESSSSVDLEGVKRVCQKQDEDSSSLAVETSTFSLLCTEQDEWSGESESVFGMVPDDVLFLMFKEHWSPSTWYATLLVCRRWKNVGSIAFNPFQTARPLMYGVFVNEKYLLRLAQSPRLAAVVLELPVLESICQRVKEPAALSVFIEKGVHTRQQWLACARKAAEKGNWAAIDCLIKAFPVNAVLSRDDALGLLKLACLRQSKTVLRMLLKRFGESDMNSILASQQFALWCCHKDLSVILAELLDKDVFRTPSNMMHVLNYSLKCRLEILVWKVFQLGALDPARHGERALEEACKRGWCIVAHVLIFSETGRVSPAEPNQKPLRLAAVCGSLPMVQLLLGHPDTDPGYEHNTPVREAIEAARELVALEMLNDPRVKVNDHRTARESLLCVTISHGYSGELLARLLALDANPNQYGHAPLKRALESHNYDALRALLLHPKIEISRTELFALFTLLGDVPACKDITATLMHSKKFSHHFDYARTAAGK